MRAVTHPCGATNTLSKYFHRFGYFIALHCVPSMCISFIFINAYARNLTEYLCTNDIVLLEDDCAINVGHSESGMSCSVLLPRLTLTLLCFAAILSRNKLSLASCPGSHHFAFALAMSTPPQALLRHPDFTYQHESTYSHSKSALP